jgi:recombinational DNA repair protein RecR
MAKGAKMLVYKDVLNRLEMESPGTKHRFYWGFLEKQKKAAASSNHSMTDIDQTSLLPCETCGQPTTAGTCSFCRMMARAKSTTG